MDQLVDDGFNGQLIYLPFVWLVGWTDVRLVAWLPGWLQLAGWLGVLIIGQFGSCFDLNNV